MITGCCYGTKQNSACKGVHHMEEEVALGPGSVLSVGPPAAHRCRPQKGAGPSCTRTCSLRLGAGAEAVSRQTLPKECFCATPMPGKPHSAAPYELSATCPIHPTSQAGSSFPGTCLHCLSAELSLARAILSSWPLRLDGTCVFLGTQPLCGAWREQMPPGPISRRRVQVE